MIRTAQLARQLDLFAAPTPTPRDLAAEHRARILAWEPANMVGRDEHGRPQVQTRAAGHGGIITLYTPGQAEPYELNVRGMECVVSNGSTHVIGDVGGRFWSETGFRSFSCGDVGPEDMRTMIEAHIDAPRSRDGGGGLGGKLLRWWPSYVRQWQQSLAFELQHGKDRSTVWDQWGPEKWEDCWHRHDMALADAIEQMREEGIDPNDIGPPAHFKGKWPTFDQGALL